MTCTEIKRERTNTDDAKSSGSPKEDVNQENFKNVHKRILADCKKKVIARAETVCCLNGIKNISLCGIYKWMKLACTPESNPSAPEFL